MDRARGRKIVGGALALIGIYPIVTATQLQNLASGCVLFLLSVAILFWGYRR